MANSPLFLPSHGNFNYGHRVIPEDIHHLDRDLASPRRAFVKDAGQFQRAVFLGAEGLPLVFKDVIPGPAFFPFAAFLVLHADDLALALKVEIHGPVINPIRPPW